MVIDYQKFLDESMRDLVRRVLTQVQNEGLHSNHHFYISFRTDDPLVRLSPRIKQSYPKEITIILQYQFENLMVLQDKFLVNISFDGARETIEIPFRALISFVDPSVKFSLQFIHGVYDNPSSLKPISTDIIDTKLKNTGKNKTNDSTANVIMLDKFRNKKNDA